MGDVQIITAQAASWIANPGITEEQTIALESDPRIHRREYGAIPSNAVGAVLPPEVVERFFLPRPFATSGEYFGLLDFSKLRKDRITTAVASWVTPLVVCPEFDPAGGPEGRAYWCHEYCGNDPDYIGENGMPTKPAWADRCYIQRPNGTREPWTPPKPERAFLKIHEIDAIEGGFFDHPPADEVVANISNAFKAWGVSTVFGDQYEAWSLASHFAHNDLTLLEYAFSPVNKPKAVAHMARWFQSDSARSVPHDGMRKELLAFSEVFTPSGVTYRAKGSPSPDFVSLLLVCALGDIDGQLPGSPLQTPPNYRTEVAGG